MGKKNKHKHQAPPFHHMPHRSAFIPAAGYRYPHTHFSHDPVQNLMEEIHILKCWTTSLTRLLAKLGNIHNADIKHIIDELRALIDKLDRWVKALTLSFNEYFTAEKAIYAELAEIFNNYAAFIKSLNARLYDIFYCIEKRLITHDKQIVKIQEYIEEIFEVLAQLVTGQSKKHTLTPGEDYNVTWFNGYCQESGQSNPCPYVRKSETTLETPLQTSTTTTIYISSTSTRTLTNSNTVKSGSSSTLPTFRHTNDLMSSSIGKRSWMFAIEWLIDLGDYLGAKQTGNQVWNMRPVSARASWAVMLGASMETVDSKSQLLVRADSISDGYNSQYYTAYDTTLTYDMLNMTIEATYQKTEDN